MSPKNKSAKRKSTNSKSAKRKSIMSTSSSAVSKEDAIARLKVLVDEISFHDDEATQEQQSKELIDIFTIYPQLVWETDTTYGINSCSSEDYEHTWWYHTSPFCNTMLFFLLVRTIFPDNAFCKAGNALLTEKTCLLPLLLHFCPNECLEGALHWIGDMTRDVSVPVARALVNRILLIDTSDLKLDIDLDAPEVAKEMVRLLHNSESIEIRCYKAYNKGDPDAAQNAYDSWFALAAKHLCKDETATDGVLPINQFFFGAGYRPRILKNYELTLPNNWTAPRCNLSTIQSLKLDIFLLEGQDPQMHSIFLGTIAKMPCLLELKIYFSVLLYPSVEYVVDLDPLFEALGTRTSSLVTFAIKGGYATVEHSPYALNCLFFGTGLKSVTIGKGTLFIPDDWECPMHFSDNVPITKVLLRDFHDDEEELVPQFLAAVANLPNLTELELPYFFTRDITQVMKNILRNNTVSHIILRHEHNLSETKKDQEEIVALAKQNRALKVLKFSYKGEATSRHVYSHDHNLWDKIWFQADLNRSGIWVVRDPNTTLSTLIGLIGSAWEEHDLELAGGVVYELLRASPSLWSGLP